jgi:corrinoid protein of di/trimethylamine methyltransferase
LIIRVGDSLDINTKKQTLEKLKGLIVEVASVEAVKNLVIKGLESEIDPADIVNTLSEALRDVGVKYERGEYFLSELIMAGNLSTEVVTLLKPHLLEAKRKSRGKVVIGTVSGDVHDIGKNIVIMMLNAAGYDVVDLGVDVPADKFVEAAKQEKPDILGMSALLSSTIHETKNVIRALKERGLRDKLKVIVGGRPITRKFAEAIGADGYAEDAIDAVRTVGELVKHGGKVS